MATKADSGTPAGEVVVASWHPSQWVNFSALFWGALVAAAASVGAFFAGPLFPVLAGAAWVVCLAPWLWKVIVTRNQNFTLTNERLKLATGVFNRKTDVLELYRVKDMSVEQPFLLRILGLCNVNLVTSDRTTPNLLIPALKDGERIVQLLRGTVETLRDRKRVREVDFEDSDTDGDLMD